MTHVRELVSERGSIYVSELCRLYREKYGSGFDYKRLGFANIGAFVREMPGLEWEDAGGGVVRLAQAPPPGRFPDQPAPSRETIPLVSEMRDAEGMRALAAFVAGRPDGTLDSGELARFYGSALGQGRRIAKATILAQAEHFDLVVRNKTASGFTLATTLNRTARWALVSEAEEAARPARAPVEAPAPSAAVEPVPSYPKPPPLAAVLAPVPAAAPRTEEELFAYVREVYVRAAQQGGGSAGERLAALRAAGVATDEEAQNILARLARADSTPSAAVKPAPPPCTSYASAEDLLDGSTGGRLAFLRAAGVLTGAEAEQAGWTGIPPPPPRLDALRTAGIPPPPPPPPPQPRESVHLPGFAPARFRSNSPLHDGDAAALRERSAADDRAEAGLE